AGNAPCGAVGGPPQINHAENRAALDPSLATIDGVPYVAWWEWNDTDRVTEVRVSRLSADRTGWEEIVGGASPINHAPGQNATAPSLTSIGGVRSEERRVGKEERGGGGGAWAR